MRILHICNGYADSKVHCNLTRALDDLGIEQTVYCPVREERLLGKNQFDGKHINFVYSFCIKPWYKFVYHYKRWMLYRDMKRKINLKNFDVIHAATLFSDGGLALKVHKTHGIPYIVAVRNTDINVYIRKLKHTHNLGREILVNACRIIFISKAEKKEFEESDFAKCIYKEIEKKIVCQPNGIDDFWHANIYYGKHSGQTILYVGDFSVNKNICRLADAVLQLREEKAFEGINLLIIGGRKEGIVSKNDYNIEQVIMDNPMAIKTLGFICDKNILMEEMRSCAIFAMPSIHETFGLVYLEALSQNLPVIYSKGQGIDGLFDNSVGLAVNALSVSDIKEAIRTILLNPSFYGNKSIDFSCLRWENIAKNYLEIYEASIKISITTP